MEELYAKIKTELKARPKKVTNLDGKAFLKDTVPITFTSVHWLPISPIKRFRAMIGN